MRAVSAFRSALTSRHVPRSNLRQASTMSSPQNVYDFTVKDAKGNDVSLSQYKGKVALVSNVAANCGYTAGNMAMYETLYSKYKSRGFEVLAFPCDQFGKQMGDMAVCSVKFKSTFHPLGEVDVNGDKAAPVFAYLKDKLSVPKIKWNFEKFLVDKNGVPAKHYGSKANEEEISKDIESLLGSQKSGL